MVFTEQDLNIGINPFDILNEATYVDGDSLISPITVPMVENSDIGGIVVRFSDVESLAESYGCDYIDAMLAIAEENNVDPNYMAVVVDEADIILDPYIVTELANVVVNPMRDDDPRYELCKQIFYEYYNNYPINEISNYFINKTLTGNTSNIKYKSDKDRENDMKARKELSSMLKRTNTDRMVQRKLEREKKKKGLSDFQQKTLDGIKETIAADMKAISHNPKFKFGSITLRDKNGNKYISPKSTNTMYGYYKDQFKNNKQFYDKPNEKFSGYTTGSAANNFSNSRASDQNVKKHGFFSRIIGRLFGVSQKDRERYRNL